MRQSRRLRWVAIPIAAVIALVLAGCTTEQLNGYLPGFEAGQPNVTTKTGMVSSLWVNSWIVLLLVGIVVWGLIIWCVVVYRRRKGQTGLPVQLRYNMPIEIFYTVVPLILIIGFFAYTAQDQDTIETPWAHPDETILVEGKQWSFDFQYTKEDVYDVGIQAQADTSSGALPGAVVESELPTLYLPVNKKTTIELQSRDVIHSFWVPAFLYKKDIIPGHPNYMYIEPTRIGTYEGKCAELCGEYHSAMLFQVKVVSDADYAAYLTTLKNKGYTGTLDNAYNRNATDAGTGAEGTSDNGGQGE